MRLFSLSAEMPSDRTAWAKRPHIKKGSRQRLRKICPTAQPETRGNVVLALPPVALGSGDSAATCFTPY